VDQERLLSTGRSGSEVRRTSILIATMVLAACGDATGLADLDTTGRWEGPPASGISFDLVEKAGGGISGSWTHIPFLLDHPVHGSREGELVALVPASANSYPVTVQLRFQGRDRLVGTLENGHQETAITLARTDR
jgi:hypothetical protein